MVLRRFMRVIAALLTLALALALAPGVRAQTALEVGQPEGWDSALVIPEAIDINPDPAIVEIELEAKLAEIEFIPGVKTPVWTYNGQVPGPHIKARMGDRVIIHFRNSLPEETTIHWHGVRVPNDMDGAPGMTQDPVAPEGQFRYEFVVRDAGTYWYHPHSNSAKQVGWGLYGPIVVTDPADPRELGDDLVLMLSDLDVDTGGQMRPADSGGAFGDLFGREGRVILVNGKVLPQLKVRKGKQQRWRFINAARSRYFQFAMRGNTFTRIGGDNGLAERPEELVRLSIVPGERLDVVFTPAFEPGTVTPLRWLPVDRGYGTSYARLPEDIMQIETVDLPAVTPAPIPGRFRDIAPIDLANAVEHTLDLTIKLGNNTVEMGINDVPYWKAKPLHARIGEKHIWTLKNDSPFDHPFHLHGYFFQVLDGDRVPEWKDTVNIPVKSSLRIAIDFDERPGMWMYHCHILDHAEVGMMGHLHVAP